MEDVSPEAIRALYVTASKGVSSVSVAVRLGTFLSTSFVRLALTGQGMRVTVTSVWLCRVRPSYSNVVNETVWPGVTEPEIERS